MVAAYALSTVLCATASVGVYTFRFARPNRGEASHLERITEETSTSPISKIVNADTSID